MSPKIFIHAVTEHAHHEDKMNVITILCDTLRRDHCGPYNHGQPLNQCWSREAPDWIVPTPNMDRLAARGTVFENAWCGSTPCMPARRDMHTGRFEFLERGWGPLEEEDLDLARQISGPANQSITGMLEKGHNVSQLITDHFHLWEQGSGNYHMGFTGFEFVRGVEGDCFRTDPVEFKCPPKELLRKNERHWRNVHFIRKSEEDWFCAQVFSKAATWLDRNHTHDGFYLHLDCFDPHEPWDPPQELVDEFFPGAYDVEGWTGAGPYAKWRNVISEGLFKSYRARYAANVVLVDRWLGRLLDKMDEHNLWDNTMIILTTDHGTYNGDHGRMGKLQTHQHDAVGHIPFIAYHPEHGHGERRSQLVQLVDTYTTTLSAMGKSIPEDRHGVDLIPVLKDPSAFTRDFAIAGQFGKSVTITDGDWILHQSPIEENQPLNWHGHCLARFLHYDLGGYEGGRRPVKNCKSWEAPTWLSDKTADLNELDNVAESNPTKVSEMQEVLRESLAQLGAPEEQCMRLGLT